MYSTLTPKSDKPTWKICNVSAERTMTREAFIQREVMLWGQHEIDRLLDNGYIVIRSANAPGWTWATQATH
jgi:hypothetical protein